MRSAPKKQARGVEITQILCQNSAKELQIFRNFGAPCAELIARTLPELATQNSVTSLQLLIKSSVCSDLEKCASGIEITLKLRKNLAKELQHSRKVGMQLAEKLRALGQRALRESRNVAAALSEIRSLCRSKKVRVRRRDHAKSAQKFHERIAKIPEFWRATRKKNLTQKVR